MSKINNYLSFLFEQEINDDEIENKIFTFFKENPYPNDIAIHSLADELKIEHSELETKIYSILSSFLSFGKFNKENRNENEFDPKQIEAGIKVEMEHTDNPRISKRITLDHLTEFENYYIPYLEDMEAEAKKEKSENEGN